MNHNFIEELDIELKSFYLDLELELESFKEWEICENV